jgi:hypothetical protein
MCGEIVRLAEQANLPGEWYLCRKCFKSFLKNREKFIKHLRNNHIGRTINYEVVK